MLEVQCLMAGNNIGAERGFDDIPIWAVVDWSDEENPVRFISLNHEAAEAWANAHQ